MGLMTTQLFFICGLSKRPKGQVKVTNRGSLFVFNKLETPKFYFFKGQSRRPEESWTALDDDDHVQLNTYAFDFGWLLLLATLFAALCLDLDTKCFIRNHFVFWNCNYHILLITNSLYFLVSFNANTLVLKLFLALILWWFGVSQNTLLMQVRF